jgi:hypothetical protein
MLNLAISIDLFSFPIRSSASAIASSQLLGSLPGVLSVALTFLVAFCLTFMDNLLGRWIMTADDYKKSLEGLKAELEELLNRQEDIEKRIAQVKQAIMSLAPLAEEQGESISAAWYQILGTRNVSDACLQILQAATVPLSPVEIKAQILNMGLDLSQYKNVMATIHSALKRLLQNEEITTKDNGLTYSWMRRTKGLLPPDFHPLYSSGIRGDEKPRVRVPFTKKKE